VGSPQLAYTAALGCSGFVSWTANFAPEQSVELLDAADACDFIKVREIIAKTTRLYEFAGVCARNGGRDRNPDCDRSRTAAQAPGHTSACASTSRRAAAARIRCESHLSVSY
jgi:hypothetical protein